MYTLDDIVHLSALNPREPGSGPSQAFLALVHERQIVLISPRLLVLEVAAAIGRTLGDTDRAVALATILQSWPNQTLVPLDRAMADLAANLAARLRLRGADAVYAAVARQYGTTLVTLDRQQLERLPPEVNVAGPAVVLQQMEADT